MVVTLRQSKELPGTGKHPQGRLFSPTGDYRGDPWKLAPENWMGQSDRPAHGDIRSWHSSHSSILPRYDSPESRQVDPSEHEGADWNNPEYDDEGDYNEDYTDFSVDEKERPMAQYGSAVGMHFGSLKAASDREDRGYAHPVRIPASTIAEPPRGNFSTERPGGSIAAGPYRSTNIIRNSETGEEVKDTRWNDAAANFASKATDLVESGKTLAYRNDVEAVGSTSYRALPESTRTWGEDVLNAKAPGTNRPAGGSNADWTDEHAFRNQPHPALVHLAERGYNPVAYPAERKPQRDPEIQLALPLHAPDAGHNAGAATLSHNAANVSRERAFHEGRTWHMRKGSPDPDYYD